MRTVGFYLGIGGFFGNFPCCQLWVAILLFFLSIACIVLSARKLRQKRTLRVACIALCAVIAAACAVYIALTAIMLYAASTK